MGGKLYKKFLARNRVGDKVEAGFASIPAVKRLPCYDKDGKLKPESRCGKTKKFLNGERLGVSSEAQRTQ